MRAFIRDTSFLARLLPVVLAAALCACGRKEPVSQKETPPPASPTPVATAAVNTPQGSPAAAESPLPTPSPTASPATDSDEEPEDTPEGARSQLGRYFATTDRDKRTEVIASLQGMTVPEAAEVVAQIIPSENDPELKTQLINILGDAEANIDLKLATLAPLVRADQQSDVRQAAMDALEQLDDARSIPVWQSLLNDPDEEIRQDAQDAIDRLK